MEANDAEELPGRYQDSAGTPPEDKLQPVHLLRAVAMELQQSGAEFATRNALHPTDLRALTWLLDAARAGLPATPGRLGRDLGLNSAGTTAVVDRLEKLGYVRRTRDADDRRRVLLTVEERAIALGWEFFGPLIGAIVAVADTYTPTEVAVIERFLRDVKEAVRTVRNPPHAGD